MALFRTSTSIYAAFALAVGLASTSARAHNGFDSKSEGFQNETPKELADVGIDDHLGGQIDLGLTFKNEEGQTVSLASINGGRKPILLTLAYFGCPSLCSYHLNGLNDSFKQLKEPLGREFDLVVVSIEPKETSELAKQKRAAYVRAYGRTEGENGWHFLVGEEKNIRKLAAQVGFKYRWDETEKQWAHASAAYAITPEGRISRYFYGITFDPKMIHLSMVEASNGTIGTIVDKLTLFCFHFDPKENKYTVAAFNVMRAGGGLTVLVLAAFLVPFWLRNRKEGPIDVPRDPDGNSNSNGVQGEA